MQEKSVQHYRVTLDQAKQDYQDGLLTATGLVYYAIAILRPIGQKLRIKDIRNFVSDLGINKATFYRAISKLKLKDLLDWDATEGLDVWASLSKGIASLPSSEVPPSTQESETLAVTGQSQVGDCDGSKLALCKGSEASPDITDIYQIFLISLSNGERENFEIFSRKSADMLPSKPVLLDKWIATHHEELYRRFKNSTEGTELVKQAIAIPSLEQMAELQKLKDTGEIKNFHLNSFGGNGTIVVDTGSAVLLWHEFFETAILKA